MKNKLSYLVLIVGIATLITGSVMIENAQANQPHMVAALDSLRNAREQLNEAERDKGGHRTAAVNLIDQAIGEVKAGIAAGE